MNRIKSSLIPAALAAATLGLGTAASANPHLKVCLDPTVSAQTLADFCQRAVDFGFLSDEQEAAALTNIGVDFGFAVDVDQIRIWVDRALTATVANSFSWTVYTSPDNRNNSYCDKATDYESIALGCTDID